MKQVFFILLKKEKSPHPCTIEQKIGTKMKRALIPDRKETKEIRKEKERKKNSLIKKH